MEEKVTYSLIISKTEEADLHKKLDKEDLYNTDLALIGAIILEARDRGDLKKCLK